MRVTFTDAARDAVRAVRETGRARLVMVLSNGCCDSTAPYLYDDHIAEPGSERVGALDGVDVLAPEWIRRLYPDDDVQVDVIDEPNDDSMSLD